MLARPMLFLRLAPKSVCTCDPPQRCMKCLIENYCLWPFSILRTRAVDKTFHFTTSSVNVGLTISVFKD